MMMSSTGKVLRERSLATTLLLASGVVGPLIFILVFLIEGATRPDYSAWHHFVSSLSLGPGGWMQITNFIICGVLMLGFALGLRRVLSPGKGATWTPILIGIFGLSLIGAGFFVTDPLLNYPPGAPETLTQHGKIHLLLSLIAFTALIAACFVVARRFGSDPAWRGWALYSILSGILVLAFFIGADVAAATLDPNAPAGLIQRLSIITGWGWSAMLAYRLGRKGPPA